MNNINRLLSESKSLKNFPNKMEKPYIKHYNLITDQFASLYIPLGLLFMMALIVCDIISFQENFFMIFSIRMVSVIIIVICYILHFFNRFHKYSQFYICFILFSVDAGLNTIIAISQPQQIAYNYYFIGVFLLVSVTYCMVRIRFIYANILAAIIILSYVFVVFIQFQTASTEQMTVMKMIIFHLIFFSLLCAATCYFLEHFSRRDFLYQKLIQKEQKRSEELLLNILPTHTVEKLKSGPSIIAESYENVTILFADIVGFTKLSRELPPSTIVSYLNYLFSQFDDLSDQYQLEKIKTIGDAYMVSSKIEDPKESAAEKVLTMATAMLQVTEALNQQSEFPLQIRIGINSGPVVAGVIGKKKFAYDMWGDTVNTAYRVESSGINGKIQVSESTYHILKEKFRFKERGNVNVKGIGDVQLYLLEEHVESF